MVVPTKQRMIEAAAGLLQRGGLAASSFTDVVRESGAARGAIYHHFPGGKTELAQEAVAWTGRRVRDKIATVRARTPTGLVAEFLAIIRPVVARAATGNSCAVAAITAESAQLDPTLTEAVDLALQSWVDELEQRLREAGADPTHACTMAVLLVIFLEGSQVLCRAAGSLAAFDAGAVGVAAAASALFPSTPARD